MADDATKVVQGSVSRFRRWWQFGLALLWLTLGGNPGVTPLTAAADLTRVVASSSDESSSPAGAYDGQRFLVDQASRWSGDPNRQGWWWQLEFESPRQIGAILQVVGDHPRNLRNSPKKYVWQHSDDGQNWQDLSTTFVNDEKRMVRIHRLPRAIQARFLRLAIDQSLGSKPTIREVEVYPALSSKIDVKDWVVSVSSLESSELSTEPCMFTQLIQQCEDWSGLEVQQVWHGDFDKEFVSAEPRPLCAFLSGSFLEWCQRSREPWRGVQEVLAERNLPMWGACGGAQVLAILQETGVDRPWDCPRCRNPDSPLLPVYSHIGHTGDSVCGEYGNCIAERGKFQMRIVAQDSVFAGLPEVFEIMESHVGQIAYVPEGWVRVVTAGPGAHTVNQCIRVKDRPIYAAQFHIELPGTEENSRRILSNFLSQAKAWGGYNPQGVPLPEPKSIAP